MTAISIWYNDEKEGNPCLWISADSRVSANGGSLIEDAAKVFSLPVVCRSPSSTGLFTDIYFQHTLGYCFAGSTLMGQNTYLALQPLLSDLVSIENYIPSLNDIGEHALSYMSLSFDEYKFKIGAGAMFEVAIFGYCYASGDYQVCHVYPRIEDDICQLALNVITLTQASEFLYLGDNKEVMIQKIRDAFSSESVPGRPATRIPRYVIQDEIDDESSATIGGDIQLAIASKSGFQPFKLCKPYVEGNPNSYMSYLGRELTPEISQVGRAIVGGPAMP